MAVLLDCNMAFCRHYNIYLSYWGCFVINCWENSLPGKRFLRNTLSKYKRELVGMGVGFIIDG